MKQITAILLVLLAVPCLAETQQGTKNGYEVFEDSAATGTPITDIGESGNGPEDIPAKNFALLATGRPAFTVDTVADLTAMASPYLIDGQTYKTLRYSTNNTVGDGSGNLYRYVAADATTADGGFVVTHASGRFHAVDKSVAYAAKFGVRVGAAAADNATATAVAIAAASANRVPLRFQSGEIDITTIDLSDFLGPSFEGAGREAGGTNFVIDGTQTYGLRLETMNDCTIKDFRITGSSDVTYGIYAHEYRRSTLQNIRVDACVTNYRLGYSWLSHIEECISHDPNTRGYLVEDASVNGITIMGCNNTASAGTATWGWDIDDANSVKIIGITNEGSDGAGIRIGPGVRVVSFDGGHIETEGNGFYMQSNSSSPLMNLSIKHVSFFEVDTPITCSQLSPGALEFSNNFIDPATAVSAVVINLQAYEGCGRNNTIAGATAAELANAYTFHASINGGVKIEMGGGGHDRLEFGAKWVDFKKNRLILSGYSAALADIDTYRKIQPGCAGKFTMVKEVSGTETAIDTWLFRVNADDSITAAQIAGESSGTALITALGYNGTTDLLQVQSASGTGSAFVKIETLVDY